MATMLTGWLRDDRVWDPGFRYRLVQVDEVTARVTHGAVGWPMCVSLRDDVLGWVHVGMAGWDDWPAVEAVVRGRLTGS